MGTRSPWDAENFVQFELNLKQWTIFLDIAFYCNAYLCINYFVLPRNWSDRFYLVEARNVAPTVEFTMDPVTLVVVAGSEAVRVGWAPYDDA